MTTTTITHPPSTPPSTPTSPVPTLATDSGLTRRCGCPRRLAGYVRSDVADEVVRIYKAGANVMRLVELSGLSYIVTTELLQLRGVPLRRGGGQRGVDVRTEFQFPPRGGLSENHPRHHPGCPAHPDNKLATQNRVRRVRRGTRVTFAVIVVSLVIASESDRELCAHKIVERSGLAMSTVSTVLRRMFADGWFTDRRESADRDHPYPCRLFRPTTRGLAALRRICDHAQNNDIYQTWLPATLPVVPDEGPGNDRHDNRHDGQGEPVNTDPRTDQSVAGAPTTTVISFFSDLFDQTRADTAAGRRSPGRWSGADAARGRHDPRPLVWTRQDPSVGSSPSPPCAASPTPNRTNDNT
jgi:DNA-binding MarR family transcriptional regulator